MRLLHTSDWHLGRSLHRVSLLGAQAAFLDFLVATAREERVDAVLVAGDVYDRAVPPLAAIRLYDDVVHRLAALDVPVVLISGNHDSPLRLGVGAGLVERAGIHLRTDPGACARPVLLPGLAVYGVPYLEPALVRDELGVGSGGGSGGAAGGAAGGGHAAVLGAAMARVRADLATRPAGTRSVVLAHAFVTGGQGSDSERDISVGGVASVPASVFDGVDYVALGHLHGCQTLGEESRLRYSGSPLAYSFSEAGQEKSMWLVELDDGGAVRAERVPCPVPRPLARIRGRLAELLEDPALERHEDAWVEATVTDVVRPEEPMARLARRFPHVLSLVFDPERPADAPAHASYGQRVAGRDDRQVAEDFVAHVRGGAGPDAQEREWLRDALEAARVGEARAEGDRPSGARASEARARDVGVGEER
ncbi:exonuclease SbcCD subunit D [Streptomyces sp. 4N509B]|uniref:exonuclease SbcCD subunit D n=1 Tax=Streptomyces sp. 4N509B TaxID=3457413 RepID=UPI003FCF9911